MAEAQSYRQLEVWQKAVELATEAHRLAARLPAEPNSSLSNRLVNSALSVASHIAEGYVRKRRASYLVHLVRAQGALAEFETLVMVAVRLELLTREDVAAGWDLSRETGHILHRMIRSLES